MQRTSRGIHISTFFPRINICLPNLYWFLTSCLLKKERELSRLHIIFCLHWSIWTLVIKAQEVVFSTIGNVHSTPLNDKSQVVLELISPITIWILWKQRCRRVFSNQSAHPTMLLQEIWSESVATLIWWPQGRLRWSSKTTNSLHPAMVVLSLSRVSGLSHKMELSHPYRDLYITHL